MSDATDKELISKTQTVYTAQYKKKKQNKNTIKKWAEDPNRHFFKEDVQMLNST